MQVAVVLYRGFTALDGRPVRGPGVPARVEMVLVAEQPGVVMDETGLLGMTAAAGLDEVGRTSSSCRAGPDRPAR